LDLASQPDLVFETPEDIERRKSWIFEYLRDSERRKRKLFADWQASERALFRAKNPNLIGCYQGVRTELKGEKRSLASPVMGKIRLKAYAHNRITLCAFQGGTRLVAKRFKENAFRGLAKGKVQLDICRKSRHGLRIGGRLRHKPVATKFTSRARNMIRDAGYLIESETSGVPLFLTLTCPGGTNEVYEAFSIGSGYIVDRFNRWLRYKVKESWFAYVWEVQKRGAPHLHYMFKMASGASLEGLKREIRAEWRKILLDVSGESGVNLFRSERGRDWSGDVSKPVIDIREITTSVAGYLAKYASKTSSKGLLGSSFIPGRWWGVSYSLREQVSRRRVEIVLEFDSLSMAKDLVSNVVSRIQEFVGKIWRPDTNEGPPADFYSIVVGHNKGKSIVETIQGWVEHGIVPDFRGLLEGSKFVNGELCSDYGGVAYG
jgi:hypothetical protein